MTGPGGSFVLYFPMGMPAAVLPSEERWAEVSPAWAADLWPQLRAELEEWCHASKVGFDIDPGAGVY